MRITSAYLNYTCIDMRRNNAYNKCESKVHIFKERRKKMKINALKVQILMGERGLKYCKKGGCGWIKSYM